MGAGEDAEGEDGGVDVQAGGEAGGDDECRDVGRSEHVLPPVPKVSKVFERKRISLDFGVAAFVLNE